MNGGQDLGHSGLAYSEHMTRSAALDMKPHFPGSILGSLLLSRCILPGLCFRLAFYPLPTSCLETKIPTGSFLSPRSKY